MPVVIDGGKTWTIRLQKGNHFRHDPVFKGKPRELVAGDYVYAIKLPSRSRSAQRRQPSLTELIERRAPRRRAARKPGAKLDHDAPIKD